MIAKKAAHEPHTVRKRTQTCYSYKERAYDAKKLTTNLQKRVLILPS